MKEKRDREIRKGTLKEKKGNFMRQTSREREREEIQQKGNGRCK